VFLGYNSHRAVVPEAVSNVSVADHLEPECHHYNLR
jgi:hypothetical protein